MPKIIGICGIYRSGSTWQFNVVKRILHVMGYTTSQCNNPWLENAYESDKDYHIIKTHHHFPELEEKAWKIFTSNRKQDEIIKSWERIKELNPTFIQELNIDECQAELAKWDLVSNHKTWFGALATEGGKITEIRNIAHALDIILELGDAKEIYTFVEGIKTPESGFDEETLLFYNHISAKKNG